jgi:hypothetical protein
MHKEVRKTGMRRRWLQVGRREASRKIFISVERLTCIAKLSFYFCGDKSPGSK